MGDGLLDEPSPAGSHPNWPSPYGALDMAGNVQEWVSDWQDDDYHMILVIACPTLTVVKWVYVQTPRMRVFDDQ